MSNDGTYTIVIGKITMPRSGLHVSWPYKLPSLQIFKGFSVPGDANNH